MAKAERRNGCRESRKKKTLFQASANGGRQRGVCAGPGVNKKSKGVIIGAQRQRECESDETLIIRGGPCSPPKEGGMRAYETASVSGTY